ncbi:MAG: ABC transporter permease [Thermoleophilaceae bacterium]
MAETTLREIPAAAKPALLRPPRSLWSDAWHQFRRHRLAMGGVVVFSLLTLATLLGPYVYTVRIDNIDFTQSLTGPSLAHPFGTDDLGRDLLARCLQGGRISIAVGVAAMLIAMTLGTLIGSIAGFFARADSPLMRVTDLFIALPTLPLLLLVIFLFRDPLRAALGPVAGIFILTVVVIGMLNWMPVARLVRAAFLSLKQREFVQAARSVGVPDGRLIFRHILPNALSPVLVAATLAVGAAIITESALSFLGLGFPPDEPTWGRLLNDAQQFLDIAPHLAIFPGLLIFLAVISINYIGDGLRDALDPRKTG